MVDDGWTEGGRMVKSGLRGVWLVVWLGQHSMGELGRRQTLSTGWFLVGIRIKAFSGSGGRGGGRFNNLAT